MGWNESSASQEDSKHTGLPHAAVLVFQSRLTADLWILDALLTGQDPCSGRGDEDLMVDVFDFLLGREYYLSDGGYSRVVYLAERGPLQLTGNSTDRVRQRWNDPLLVATVRDRINRRCQEFMKLWENA